MSPGLGFQHSEDLFLGPPDEELPLQQHLQLVQVRLAGHVPPERGLFAVAVPFT